MNPVSDNNLDPAAATRASVTRTGRLAAAMLLAVTGLTAFAQEVIPDFYNDPGMYPNRSYVNQHANEAIDPFTGGLQWHFTDIHLPGNGGFDLKVVRSYNSASINPENPANFDSLAGQGWTVHFGRVLKSKETSICYNKDALTVGDNPVLELPDGSRQLLTYTGGSAPLALTAQRWRADCAAGQSGLVVYSPDGLRYDMTQLVNVGSGVKPVYAWFAKKITDRNGNYATISYANGASPEITNVTTSDGRSIDFTYADSGTFSRRITSITASGGQTFTYGYQQVSGVPGLYQLTSVTRPGGTSWNFAYNDYALDVAGSYAMNRVTYPEGGTVSYTFDWAYFDSQGNPSYRATVVTGKTVSGGGNWTFSYTPGSLGVYDTTTVTSPAGTTTYRHVGPNYAESGSVWMVGLLMSKTIGSAQTETYTWTKQKISSETFYRPGQFVAKKDLGETNAPLLAKRQIERNGATHTTTYSGFDAYGNATTVTESGPNGGSRTTSLSYYVNTTKWIVKQPQNETYSGSSLARTFDDNGNVASINQDGVVTNYFYDSEGNVNSVTYPRGLVHTYSDHKRGIPQSEHQPENVNLTRVVSDAGNVVSETNGEGETRSYTYDGLNRVTGVVYPTGNAVSIAYGTTTKTATRGGLTESTVVDGFGRVKSITLGGIARTFSYDALGRKTFASNPGSSSGTSYQYDILDRVTKITFADAKTRSFAYGAGSVAITDERAKKTTQTFRAYGDPERQFLMGITAPVTAANVTIARNSRGQVTSLTQGGLTRSYGYNANAYLTSVVNPETGTTTYGRDAAGNMTTRSIGASGTTNYTYDGQNRLTAVAYPGSTPSVAKTYTRTHKLKTVVSSAASRSYTYDANDNLTAESVTVDGLTLATGYDYNDNDQLASLTYPQSGRVVSYSPDVLGRPTQVSGYVTAVAYWPSGQLKQIDYGNGTVSTYGQNSRLWPSSFATQKGTTYFHQAAYTYDGAGNLTAIADTADSSYNRSLGYDAINRLTSVSGPWGSGTIAYNGTGNLTSQVFGSSSLTYTYDSQNRLASVAGSRSGSYTYDAYGDMVTAAGATYAWDGVPNLACINCAVPANKIEHTYDGLNQRVTVTKGGVKTYEAYGAQGKLLAAYTPSQGKLIEYLYLGGKRIAQRETRP